MNRNLLIAAAIMMMIGITTAASFQPQGQDDRRAAITVLRAINTAENAVLRSGGKFVPMAELLDHPAMARVKPNISVSGNAFSHAGAEVRIALSADAKQYVVAVVPAVATGAAAFTDERGLIYTGQALQ